MATISSSTDKPSPPTSVLVPELSPIPPPPLPPVPKYLKSSSVSSQPSLAPVPNFNPADIVSRLPIVPTFSGPSNTPVQTPEAIINSIRSEAAIIKHLEETLLEKRKDSEKYLGQLLIVACGIDSDIDYSSTVNSLLREPIDINTRTPLGNTPLIAASCKGKLNIVEILLKRGANVEIANNTGFTALHLAACYGHPKIVNLLIAAGAKVDAEGKQGQTPLHRAARSGKSDVVKILLDNGAKIDYKDQRGYTSLHIATVCDRVDVVEILLSRGAGIDEKDKNEYSPLYAACRIAIPRIVNMLLARGAKIDNGTTYGETALHIITHNINPEQIKIIGKSGLEPGAILFDNRRSEVVKILLNNGIDINVKAKGGFTPLHTAAKYNDDGFSKILLNYGADVDAESADGSTPLHYAALNDNPRTLELLLDRGAKVNAKNKIGCTPLHIAAQRGNAKIVKILLSKGAEVNAQNNKQITSLHRAARYGHIETIQALIDGKAEIDIRDSEGATPLHLASDKPDAVELLISSGADIDANVTGYPSLTPILIAVLGDHPKIARLLLDKGCKITREILNAIMSIKEPTETQKSLIVACKVIYKYQNASEIPSKSISAIAASNTDDSKLNTAKRGIGATENGGDIAEIDNTSRHLNKKLGIHAAINNEDDATENLTYTCLDRSIMTRKTMEKSMDLDNM